MKKQFLILSLFFSVSSFAGENLVQGYYIANDQSSPVQSIVIRSESGNTNTYYLRNFDSCSGSEDRRLEVGGKTTNSSPETIRLYNASMTESGRKTCDKEVNISKNNSNQLIMTVENKMKWFGYGEVEAEYTFSRISKEQYVEEVASQLTGGDIMAYSEFLTSGDSIKFDDTRIAKELAEVCNGHFLRDCDKLPTGLKIEDQSEEGSRVFKLMKN